MRQFGAHCLPPKSFNESVQLAAGSKKEIKAQGEVAGHGDYSANYSCYFCGRLNFVPGGIYAFYCWFCGRLNLAP
jgi:hypothetical protein